MIAFKPNFSNYWNPDGEHDNEDDDDDSNISYGRDAVIFLVDAADNFASDEEQFRNCLSLIEVAMMNRIIQSEKDLVN